MNRLHEGIRISSKMTYFQKRVFPVIWFSILAIVTVGIAVSSKTPAAMAPAVAPVFMGILGYFVMRKLVFDLADEVYDCGDSLLIRSGSKEQRVQLGEIINVSHTLFINPQRVTLTLRNPTDGKLKDISFQPPHYWMFSGQGPFRPSLYAKHPLIDDLILRIEDARTKRK
jgi:hypothetical protein